ncbi:MAG: alpha/beta hydrolase [Chloroflexi bacterium]|nr:alpha/beta hydrolase [Chloroflexota bacterium]
MDAAIATIRLPEFPSAHVPPRPVDVWLPPGYETGPACSVLYMHDGQNLFAPAQSYSGVTWGIAETLSRLISAGRVPPALVVGIHNTRNRVGEYLPYKAMHVSPAAQTQFRAWADAELANRVERDEDWQKPRVVSDDYLRFMVEELKPFIDSTYNTRPGSAHTVVMGSSMGGLISAYAFCEYPDVFGRAGCLSTHWPLGDGVMLHYLQAALPAPDGRRIYFDYGAEGPDAEYGPYQQQADALLVQRGYRPDIDFMSRFYSGDPHHESAWARRLHIPLEFLLVE